MSIDSIYIYVFTILVNIITLIAFWKYVAGSRLFFSPAGGFLILHEIFWFGTLLAIDADRKEDLTWISFMTIASLFFVVGNVVGNSIYSFKPEKEVRLFSDLPVIYDLNSKWITFLLYGMGAFGLVVGIIYAQAVGYNVFLTAVQEFMTSGKINQLQYSTMRTSISTEKYVAAGYAIQVTAILLPIILYMLYFRVVQRKNKIDIAYLCILLIADLYFLTITGGRGLLIFAALGFILLTSKLGPLPFMWKKVRKAVLIMGAILLFFYFSSTVLMGRVGEDQETWGKSAERVSGEFYDRIIGEQTKGHLELMRILIHSPISLGENWWLDLLSMLPDSEKTKKTRSGSEFYFLLYGDTSGSLGLTPWGSLLYNWGYIGGLVWALLLGIFMQSFLIWLVRGERLLSKVIVLFIAGFKLILFRDPYSLFLDGFVTAVCFYFLMIAGKRTKSVTQTVSDLVESQTNTGVENLHLDRLSH